MSQNLTQPEEIDHVLMEMAGHDTKVDMPVTDKKYLNGTAQESECGESAVVTSFSYGAVHKKSIHGLPDS